MKLHYTLLLLMLLAAQVIKAQVAIIQDKDGFCNVREDAGTDSKILDKLSNGHMVFCFTTKGNWTLIDYNNGKAKRHGYVHTDRLNPINSYLQLSPIAKGDSISFNKDSIKVIVSQAKFDKRKYRFTYYKENPDQIQLINGKQYWGHDGGMPTTIYKSIVIHIGAKTTSMPANAFNDLFEPNLYNTSVYYDAPNDILYINSSNSDGAGYYEITWRVKKGVYKDRYIAYGF